MWEAFAKIIAEPNFIQGGMTIVVLALLGVLVYLVKMVYLLVQTFAERVSEQSKEYAQSVRDLAEASNQVIRSAAEADRKLAESLGRYSQTIESFGRIVERKI